MALKIQILTPHQTSDVDKCDNWNAVFTMCADRQQHVRQVEMNW